MSLRAVKDIIQTTPTIEGAGVKLQRAFGFLAAQDPNLRAMRHFETELARLAGVHDTAMLKSDPAMALAALFAFWYAALWARVVARARLLTSKEIAVPWRARRVMRA